MSSLTLVDGVGSRGTKEVVQRTSSTGVDGVTLGGTIDLRKFVLTTASYTEATKVIHEAGAFTSYTWTSGDTVLLVFSDGHIETAEIASKTDANNIVLAASVNRGANDTGVTNLYYGEDVKYVEAQVVLDGTSTVVTAWKRLVSQNATNLLFAGEFRNNDGSDIITIGGWYNWQVRVIGVSGTVLATFTDTTKWGVGYVFLLTGQSNMEWMSLKNDTPAAAHDKVSMFSLSYRTGSANTDGEWADLTANPEGDGIHAMGNELRTRYAAQHGFDVPVGIVQAAIGGSSLLHDYQLTTGYWLDRTNNPGSAFRAAMDKMKDATGKLNVEVICWQQGEDETTAITTLFRHIFPGTYRSALFALKNAFEGGFHGPNGTPGIVWSPPANVFSLVTFTGDAGPTNAPSAPITQNEIVQEDFHAFTDEFDQYVCQALDCPMEQDATKVTEGLFDYGIHWSIEGLERYGKRLAQVAYSVNGTTKVIKKGPRIASARIGSESDMTDRTKVYVECTLDPDNGSTTLVLGDTGSIHLWEIWDQKGPLAVTAVTLKNARFLELTVERDLVVAGAHPTLGYDYPDGVNMLVGNHFLLRYAALSTFQEVTVAGNSNFLIVDDAADPMPLAQTYGMATDRPITRQTANFDLKTWNPTIAHTPLRDIKSYNLDWILADIDSVNLAAAPDTFVLADYTLWDKSSGTSGYNWPQPGDRFMIEDATGLYVHEAIVKRVSGIAANKPTVELTHDMNSNSTTAPYNYKPTAAHRVRMFRPKTPCGLIGKSAINADSFGMRPAILESQEAKYVV